MNNPFISNNINIIDEHFYTATPTCINGQNVFVSHAKDRKLLESLNTSVVGNTHANFRGLSSYGFSPGNVIQAEKYFVPPNGVLFTFSNPHDYTYGNMYTPQTWFSNPTSFGSPKNHYPCASCPTLHRRKGPINEREMDFYRINGIHPHCSNLSNYQQLAENPFFYQCQQYPFHQLKFHMNAGTSSSDLLQGGTQFPGSQGTADFKNLCGLKNQYDQSILYQGHKNATTLNTFFHDNAVQATCDGRSSARQLTVCNPPTPPQGHVADVLNEETKNVTFQDQIGNTTTDKAEQTSFYTNGQEDRRRKGKRYTKKKSKGNNTNNSSTDEDRSRSSSFRRNKKKEDKHQDTEHETSETTTDY